MACTPARTRRKRLGLAGRVALVACRRRGHRVALAVGHHADPDAPGSLAPAHPALVELPHAPSCSRSPAVTHAADNWPDLQPMADPFRSRCRAALRLSTPRWSHSRPCRRRTAPFLVPSLSPRSHSIVRSIPRATPYAAPIKDKGKIVAYAAYSFKPRTLLQMLDRAISRSPAHSLLALRDRALLPAARAPRPASRSPNLSAASAPARRTNPSR